MKSTHTQSRNMEAVARTRTSPSAQRCSSVGCPVAATSSKRGRFERPVDQVASEGTGRVVALFRHHSGTYLPGD